MVVGVDDDLGRAVGRLEGGKAVVEDRDLEGGERDLGLRSSRSRRAQRAVIARRQERALLAVDRVVDLLAAQLVEALADLRSVAHVRAPRSRV